MVIMPFFRLGRRTCLPWIRMHMSIWASGCTKMTMCMTITDRDKINLKHERASLLGAALFRGS